MQNQSCIFTAVESICQTHFVSFVLFNIKSCRTPEKERTIIGCVAVISFGRRVRDSAGETPVCDLLRHVRARSRRSGGKSHVVIPRVDRNIA